MEGHGGADVFFFFQARPRHVDKNADSLLPEARHHPACAIRLRDGRIRSPGEEQCANQGARSRCIRTGVCNAVAAKPASSGSSANNAGR